MNTRDRSFQGLVLVSRSLFSPRLDAIFFLLLEKGRDACIVRRSHFLGRMWAPWSWWWRACLNSTGFDCARKGASAQPTSGWGGDAFDSGGHPCGLGGDGSRGENYECWSTRVAERQGSARWKGVGVALNPSKLQRCSLSRLSPESRARAESTLEACSYRVPRRAFPSALSRRCRPRFSLRVSPVSLASSDRSSINGHGGFRWIERFRRAENFPPSSHYLVVDRAKGFEKSKYAWIFDLLWF